ncbi:MAG: hypothetical protein K1X72_20840 [Pyrinomonadaceae bacterium]|nr:hypothetical protein [Pyrinomonadaceae bacterium]
MNKTNNRFVGFGWLMLFFTFALPIIVHSQTPLPPSVQDALDKGIIAAKLPDYPLAIKYFEEARKIAPDAPIIYFNLGLAESKIPGRELRAICWFAAYLTAEPNTPNRAAILEQIKILEVKNQRNFQRIVEAMKAGAKSNTNFYEDSFWEDIVRIWIKAGDISEAIKSADQIRDDHYKNRVKIEIVDALIANGDLAQAEKIASNLTEGNSNVRVMIASAEDKIWSKDFKAAQEILKSAANYPVKVDNYRERMKTISKIAELQSKAGDKEGVQTTLEKLQQFYNELPEIIFNNKPEERGEYLIFIADGKTIAGDIAGAGETLLNAHKIADSIPPYDKKDIYATDKKSKLLQLIAVQEAKNGNFDLSLNTAKAITDGYYQYLALNEIAKFQAKSGDVPSAKKTIDLITGFPKYTALILVATEQINNGDRSGAIETSNLILSDEKLNEKIKQKKGEVYEGDVEILTKAADLQILVGDVSAARKTLAIAQQLCDRIPNNKGYITEENSNRKAAQYDIDLILGKIGRTDSPGSVWVFYTEDSNSYDDAPLNSTLFLDLSEHLKSLPQSNDPSVFFNALKHTVEKMITAKTAILGLLKERSIK